jgi:hypothetical protein
LFWPRFFEHDGCVFIYREGPEAQKWLKDSYKSWFKEFKGKKADVEGMINHLHILDILGSRDINKNSDKPYPTKEQVVYLGRILKNIWECKLKRDFPKKVFKVEFYEKNITDLIDYQMTFYQKRKGK